MSKRQKKSGGESSQRMRWKIVSKHAGFLSADIERDKAKSKGKAVKVHRMGDGVFAVKVGTPLAVEGGEG